MATNLAIDNDLLTQALELGEFKSKKETVNTLLREFIQRQKQLEVIDLFGTIKFDDQFDCRKMRGK